MAYKITYTERFEKHYKRLHDKERIQLKKKLRILSENPFHPSKKKKKVQGTDFFECSVNMDIRIIWLYQDGALILLLDVGHHDILQRY